MYVWYTRVVALCQISGAHPVNPIPVLVPHLPVAHLAAPREAVLVRRLPVEVIRRRRFRHVTDATDFERRDHSGAHDSPHHPHVRRGGRRAI